MADEQTGQEQVVGEAIPVDSTVDKLAESLHLHDASIAPPEGAAPEGQTTPPAATTAPTGTDGAAATATDSVTSQAPDTWRSEAKALWSQVNPAIQAEINKREADISKYVGEVQPYVQAGQALQQTIAPYSNAFKTYGVNPVQHIGKLLYTHATLLFGSPEQKVATLRAIAQEAGINLGGEQGAVADTATQNYLRALQERDARFSRLEQSVSGVTNSLYESRLAELQKGILAFGEDSEKHPFFNELIDDCTKLIEQGSAKSLEEAYAIAELRNPTTRAKRLDLELKKQAAEQSATEQQRVAGARKAMGANVVSRGSGRLPQAEETIDQTLSSTMAKIRARA